MERLNSTPCRMPGELSGATSSHTQKTICHLLTPLSFQTCSTERLTCVDRQINVAVLGSQRVGHGAAVEARGLRRHISDVHRAHRVNCNRYRYEK